MVWGLVEARVAFEGMGVTVPGTKVPNMEGFHWSVGDHPIPGDASFAAGETVLRWAGTVEGPVLVLLSGGASACIEAPAPGHTREELVRLHEAALYEGAGIVEANRRRGTASALKTGGLGRALSQRGIDARCWILQDAPTPDTVGSGPLAGAGVEPQVLADGDTMAAAAGLRLATRGYRPYRNDRVEGPLDEVLAAFFDAFEGLPGRSALVAAGEPWIKVPRDAPPGGRNQHAALAAASQLKARGSPATFCALASDGIDGSTKEAGAWVRAEDADAVALAAFRSHAHLDARGRTLRSGPTGTNVGDLWILLSP